MDLQKRVLYQLPLESARSILACPTADFPAFLIINAQRELLFADSRARHLKFVRNNAATALWLGRNRFVVVDSTTHDLIFYKIAEIENPSNEPEFNTNLHVPFQLMSSVLMEFGVKLNIQHSMEILCVKAGVMDIFVMDSVLVRVQLDFHTRNLRVLGSWRFPYHCLSFAMTDFNGIASLKARKLYFTVFGDCEFLFVLNLSDCSKLYPVFTSVKFLSVCKSGRWLLLVGRHVDVILVLDLHQTSDINGSLMSSKCFSTQRSSEEHQMKDKQRGAVRFNLLWEKETLDLIGKNYAEQHFRQFATFISRTKAEDRDENLVLHNIPADFTAQNWEPTEARCTETESYVLARDPGTQETLLGCKRHDEPEFQWMKFSSDCRVIFTPSTIYPVLLCYTMSVVCVAKDAESGFQRHIAEAAAPDPWEGFDEFQIMELAINEQIVDKAVDYLQKRFPDASRFFEKDYHIEAGRLVARNYLMKAQVNEARHLYELLQLDFIGEALELFIHTTDIKFRAYLHGLLVEHGNMSNLHQKDFDFTQAYQSRLKEAISISGIRDWDDPDRDHKLVSIAVKINDIELVDSYPLDFIWKLLLRNFDKVSVIAWIRGQPSFTRRPINPEFVNDLEHLDSMSNEIADEFARHGTFSRDELAVWKRYLRRVMSSFGENHSFFDASQHDRLSLLPDHIRTQFLEFLINEKAVLVLIQFISEPRFEEYLNRMDVAPMWLKVLLGFCKANLMDRNELADLSLANAQLIVDMDVTVEKLLELNEIEIALCLITFAQDWNSDEETNILLQQKLSKYPKLREALFLKPLTAEQKAARNVSVYRLLQAGAAYDPKRLFGWQTTNTLNNNYRMLEMPSFASTVLQSQYGYDKELDYTYYLKNSRPSFAYWKFASELTADNVKEELMTGRDMAFFLAVFFFMDESISSSCIVFLEMLGIESLSTRIVLQVARKVHQYYKSLQESPDTSVNLVRDIFVELFKYGAEYAGSVLGDLIEATEMSIAQEKIYPSDWKASSHWLLFNQFCDLFELPLSTNYLKTCAEDNQWLNFFTFADLHNYPPTLVQALVDDFGDMAVRENMDLVMRIMKNAKKNPAVTDQSDGGRRNVRSNLYARIGVLAASDKTTSASSDDELVVKPASRTGLADDLERDDVVSVLSAAQKSLHPWRELVRYSLELENPFYAMMACEEPGVNQLIVLSTLLFLLMSEKDRTRLRIDLSLPQSLKEYGWTLTDLKAICRVFVERRNLRLLSTAIRLATSNGSLLFQFADAAADIEDRLSTSVVATKLRRLAEVADKVAGNSEPSSKADDIENRIWAYEFGMDVLACLMARMKRDNEIEWRRNLNLLRESGLLNAFDETPKVYSEALVKLIREAKDLSQSVQFDADRILELKFLLRDFQSAEIWGVESFRMEVWRSIFSRIHVELSERKSMEEVMEILQSAERTSESNAEKCVLLTIIWKLDNTDDRFYQAWQAKILYGLSTNIPLEEWMLDPVLGVGPFQADLQKQLLELGKLPLEDFSPPINGKQSGTPEDRMMQAIVGFMIQQGHLTLAARLTTVLGYLHGDLDAICTALALAKKVIQIGDIPEWINRVMQKPDRFGMETAEKDEIVLWLRAIVGVCTLGQDIIVAIIDNYLFAKCLKVSFDDMLHFSTSRILELLFATPSPDRLALARRCLISFRAPTDEVTGFIAEYVCNIVRKGLADPHCDMRNLGKNVKQFICVAIDLQALGDRLTEAALSAAPPSREEPKSQDSDLKLAVELLIAAHEAYTMAGSLDGLGRLISACKGVAKTAVSQGDFTSVIRLLNGIRRYSELTFIYHLMKDADRLELLFSRAVDKDPQLKIAILNYLRKFHPDDSNGFEMLAASYSMHREIGEAFFDIAQERLMLFKHRPIVDNHETQTELKKIIQYLMDAASNFTRADCHMRAEKCVDQARLVALQIVFLPTSLRLLSLNNPSGFVATHPRFAEAFIYAQAYGITDEWQDAIYANYVLNGDIRYLQDFSIKYQLTTSLIAEIAEKFRMDPHKPPTAPIFMKKLLRQISDIEQAFKLAVELGLNDLEMELLQVDGGCFIRDVMKI